MRSSRVESFSVAPRWLFVKIYSDEGTAGESDPPTGPPTGPGLGIESDGDALQDKIGVFRRHPGLFHPDDGAAFEH